jgi:4-hydroxy 2-oxovalerate aldolase
MKNKGLKILDCTLRDGGYYNKWDFDRFTVDRYLIGMKLAGVDVVELGFRSLPKSMFMGPYIYTTDDFISHLSLPEGLMYGVMINGSEFISQLGGNELGIKMVFQEKNKSNISLVRIAINFNDVLQTEAVAQELKKLGYIVALNMMQAHGKSEQEYNSIAKTVASWEVFDILYFADSLGNMLPEDVKRISQALKKEWPGPIGIHTHNNKNLALINSITAVENGVTMCDGTVAGMGRGAGNAATESIILELNQLGYHAGNANMMQPVVEDFTLLQKQYAWGSNLYYHYAANNYIHPTFVQALLEDKRYDNQQVLGALEILAGMDSTAYSTDSVRKAIYGNNNKVTGTWDATGWLEGEEVLIVGAGPSVEKYKEYIIRYIKKNAPAVLFLNINRFLSHELGRATLVSHETRALFDVQQYHNLNHPIVLPMARLGKLIKNQLKRLDILDYGLTLEHGSFSIGAYGCRLEWPVVIAYALSVATQAGGSRISLVGFDGYSADDPRQEEMNEIFLAYSSLPVKLGVTTLTPSTYRINHSSIFAP